MNDLRLRIFLAVFGALTTMSATLSADPVEMTPETHEEPSAGLDDASKAAPTGSQAAAASGTGAESGAATESAPTPAVVTESAPTPAAVTESAPTPAAVTEPAPTPVSDADESENPNSVSLSFLVGSIYNFRGMNVFKETSQTDQNALFSPSITGTVFHPGLWVAYAGFFQINGDNRGYLVDSGVGAEQDIAVGFDYDLTRKLTLSTSLTYRFYPFARSRITGVEWPSYLEPSVGIHFKTNRGIRLGLDLSYFAPIQERLRDERYMYTLISIGKAFQFHPKLALDLSYSAGYKLFADPTIWQDTIFDMEFCLSLPFSITDRLQAVSGVHAAWGYLSGTSFGDQYMVYFSMDLVADF